MVAFVFRCISLLSLQPLIEKSGNWSWCSQEDGGLPDKRYRYTCASLRYPPRCIGYARRRVGRGGRWVKHASKKYIDI